MKLAFIVQRYGTEILGGSEYHCRLIAERVAQRLGLPVFNTGLAGEAGWVETDGHGTLIAHESSFVNPNRNKGGKAEVERLLLDTMGAQKIIWAPGIKGADITDYTLTRWRASSSRGKS